MTPMRYFSVQPKIDLYFSQLDELNATRNEEENEDKYITQVNDFKALVSDLNESFLKKGE
jgi:hypothetical protein